jgi:hypothetical protein
MWIRQSKPQPSTDRPTDRTNLPFHKLANPSTHPQGYTVLPCEPYNATNPPIGPLLWMFYISKVFDFMDTIFIILGKKWNQLSFLHVYHHVTIFLVRVCCVLCAAGVRFDGWMDGSIDLLPIHRTIH